LVHLTSRARSLTPLWMEYRRGKTGYEQQIGRAQVISPATGTWLSATWPKKPANVPDLSLPAPSTTVPHQKHDYAVMRRATRVSRCLWPREGAWHLCSDQGAATLIQSRRCKHMFSKLLTVVCGCFLLFPARFPCDPFLPCETWLVK